MTSYALPEELRDDDKRRRRGLIWLWFAVIAVLLVGVFAAIARLNGCSGNTCGTAAGAPPGGTSQTGTGQSRNLHGAGATSVSIAVSGSERGRLAPGATRSMTVSIVNNGSKPARVTSASVSVGDPSNSCSGASSIRVTRYDASLPGALRYDVAPGAAVTIPLKISMRDLTTNQNACKNASFPLTFHATAQQG